MILSPISTGGHPGNGKGSIKKQAAEWYISFFPFPLRQEWQGRKMGAVDKQGTRDAAARLEPRVCFFFGYLL